MPWPFQKFLWDYNIVLNSKSTLSDTLNMKYGSRLALKLKLSLGVSNMLNTYSCPYISKEQEPISQNGGNFSPNTHILRYVIFL